MKDIYSVLIEWAKVSIEAPLLPYHRKIITGETKRKRINRRKRSSIQLAHILTYYAIRIIRTDIMSISFARLLVIVISPCMNYSKIVIMYICSNSTIGKATRSTK